MKRDWKQILAFEKEGDAWPTATAAAKRRASGMASPEAGLHARPRLTPEEHGHRSTMPIDDVRRQARTARHTR